MNRQIEITAKQKARGALVAAFVAMSEHVPVGSTCCEKRIKQVLEAIEYLKKSIAYDEGWNNGFIDRKYLKLNNCYSRTEPGPYGMGYRAAIEGCYENPWK